MKPYLIYLNLTLDCPDKPTREVATKARAKASIVAKEQFTKLLSSTFNNKEVVIHKEQPIEDAVAIQVNEKELDQVLQTLCAMDIVHTIDSGITFPFAKVAAQEETAAAKMQKFLK